jgi:hypothetical protein
MVVSLLRRLGGDSGLLEQIVLNETSFDLELGVETDLHETSETRRVVVANCLCITCNQIMFLSIAIYSMIHFLVFKHHLLIKVENVKFSLLSETSVIS